MPYHLLSSVFINIVVEFLTLNKFEKEKKVIELHKEGKTLKEISVEVHMSFRDISKIIKDYERKLKIEERKKILVKIIKMIKNR